MELTEIKIDSQNLPASHLSQSYSSGFEYSIINDSGMLLMPFMTCKDYMNDFIWAVVNKRRASIYGLTVDPTKPDFKVNLKNLRIVVRDKNKNFEDFYKSIQNSINFINDSFKNLPTFPEIKILNYFKYDGNKGLVINLPLKYTLAGPIMSTFFLYLRSGHKYDRNHELYKTPLKYINNMGKIEGASYRPADRGDMKASRKLMYRLVKFGLRRYFKIDFKTNYNANHNIDTIHNNYGIRSYTNSKRFTKMFHTTF